MREDGITEVKSGRPLSPSFTKLKKYDETLQPEICQVGKLILIMNTRAKHIYLIVLMAFIESYV